MKLSLRLEQLCPVCGQAIGDGERRREVAQLVRAFGLAKGCRLCRCGTMVIRRRPGRQGYYTREFIDPLTDGRWKPAPPRTPAS